MKKVVRLTEGDLSRIVKRVIKENDFESCDDDMVMSLNIMVSILSGFINIAIQKADEKGISLNELIEEEGIDVISKVHNLGNSIDKIKDGTCGKDELMEIYEDLLETIENN